MRRYLGYLIFVLVLAPVESTLPRLPGLHGVHFLLVVPLVFFFALRLNTMEGLLLSFAAGVVEGATASYPPGLASFAMVAIFIASRLALMAVKTDGPLFEAFFSFVAAVFFYGIVFAVRRLFEPRLSPADGAWISSCLTAGALTALVSPLILRVGRRIEKLQVRSPGVT